jgi:hypothetical protein
MAKSQHYINAHGEEIDFTVQVATRPNLRDSISYMFQYRGKNVLEQMFDKCEVDLTVEKFDLEYPERWANLLELRAIPERMLVCFPNLKSVFIQTHSVYLIQSVHNGHVFIEKLMGEEGNEVIYDEGDPKDLTKRYCPPNREFKGMFVATPSSIQHIL